MDYSKFSVMRGTYNSGSQYKLDYTSSTSNQQTGSKTGSSAGVQLGASVLGQIATTAIGAYSAHQMDKIRSRMVQDAREHARTMDTLARKQHAWLAQMNRDRLKESLISEQLVLEVDQMKKVGTVQAAIAASGAAGGSMKAVLQNTLRERAQARFIQQEEIKDRLVSHDVASVQPGKGVQYDAPEPSKGAALAQFGIETIRIGREAYKGYEGTPEVTPSQLT